MVSIRPGAEADPRAFQSSKSLERALLDVEEPVVRHAPGQVQVGFYDAVPPLVARRGTSQIQSGTTEIGRVSGNSGIFSRLQPTRSEATTSFAPNSTSGSTRNHHHQGRPDPGQKAVPARRPGSTARERAAGRDGEPFPSRPQ